LLGGHSLSSRVARDTVAWAWVCDAGAAARRRRGGPAVAAALTRDGN
jgi:hypothetical protein